MDRGSPNENNLCFILFFLIKHYTTPSPPFYLPLKIVTHNFSLVYVVLIFKEKSIFFFLLIGHV